MNTNDVINILQIDSVHDGDEEGKGLLSATTHCNYCS